jgi:hypothetical protein
MSWDRQTHNFLRDSNQLTYLCVGPCPALGPAFAEPLVDSLRVLRVTFQNATPLSLAGIWPLRHLRELHAGFAPRQV